MGGHLYFERVLFIPSEASRECLTCFLIFSKKKKKIILNPNFKLIKYKFFHCLLTYGIVFCTTIQNSLFLFKTSKYIYTLGTIISLILNLKYSDLPGLLDHFFVNGCSRRSKKQKKSYLRYLKKKKKKKKKKFLRDPKKKKKKKKKKS